MVDKEHPGGSHNPAGRSRSSVAWKTDSVERSTWSEVSSKHDTDPKPRGSWPDLRDRLLADPIVTADKDGVGGFVPATFRPGGHRRAVDVEHLHAWVLDLDDVPEHDATGVSELLQRERLEHVVVSSHSHASARARGLVRLRIIGPLAEPVPAAEWDDAWARLDALTGHVTDAACKDAGRFYYWPSCPIGAEPHHVRRHHGGDPLSRDRLARVDVPHKRRRRGISPGDEPPKRRRPRHATQPQPRRIDVAPFDALIPRGTRIALATAAIAGLTSTFAAAQCVVLGHALEPDDAFLIVRAWANAKAWERPATDAEIHERIEHAIRYSASLPLGYALPLGGADAGHADWGGVDVRRVPAAELGDAVQHEVAQGGTFFVVAPVGIGKTAAAERIFRRSPRALAIAPTRALAQNLAGRFGAAPYDTTDARDGSHVATTLASAYKLHGPWNLVVVDELPQCVAQCHARIERDPVGRYRGLLRALGETPSALALGADIDVELVSMLRAELPDERRVTVIVCDEHALRRDLVIVDPDRVRSELLRALVNIEPGQPPIVYASTGRAEIDAIEHLLRQHFPRLRVGKLHGKTSRAPMRDPDAWAREHEVLLMTHAAGSGVNITAPIDRVLVQHGTRAVRPSSVAQLVARCRDVRDALVLVGIPRWSEGHHETDAATIEGRMRERAEENRDLVRALAAKQLREPLDDPAYTRAWVAHRVRSARAWNRPWLDGIARGYGWSYRDDRRPERGEPQVAMGEHRRAIEDERVDAVLAARDLADDEASALRHKYDRDPDELAALERHTTRTFYGGVTEDRTRGGEGRRERIGRFVTALLVARGEIEPPAARDGACQHDAQHESHLARAELVAMLYAATYGVELGARGNAAAAELARLTLSWYASHREEFVRHWPGAPVPTCRTATRWLHDRLRSYGACVRRHGPGRAMATCSWPAEADAIAERQRQLDSIRPAPRFWPRRDRRQCIKRDPLGAAILALRERWRGTVAELGQLAGLTAYGARDSLRHVEGDLAQLGWSIERARSRGVDRIVLTPPLGGDHVHPARLCPALRGVAADGRGTGECGVEVP